MKELICLLLFAGVVWWIAEDDQREQREEVALYCDMVELHQRNPELGWPDYRGIYDEVCK